MPCVLLFWWTCTRCGDRMELSSSQHQVETDRDRHTMMNHPDWTPDRYELAISHWFTPQFDN